MDYGSNQERIDFWVVSLATGKQNPHCIAQRVEIYTRFLYFPYGVAILGCCASDKK